MNRSALNGSPVFLSSTSSLAGAMSWLAMTVLTGSLVMACAPGATDVKRGTNTTRTGGAAGDASGGAGGSPTAGLPSGASGGASGSAGTTGSGGQVATPGSGGGGGSTSGGSSGAVGSGGNSSSSGGNAGNAGTTGKGDATAVTPPADTAMAPPSGGAVDWSSCGGSSFKPGVSAADFCTKYMSACTFDGKNGLRYASLADCMTKYSGLSDGPMGGRACVAWHLCVAAQGNEATFCPNAPAASSMSGPCKAAYL